MLSWLWCSTFLSSSMIPSLHSNCLGRKVYSIGHSHKRQRTHIILNGIQSSDSTTTDTVSPKSRQTYDNSEEVHTSSSLSDVDARVLQSMLQDSQLLDSMMKDNIQQLLSDDQSPSSKQKQEQQQQQKNEEPSSSSSSSSEYTSALFKSMEQLNSSQFFNTIKAKADEFIESFQILVSNRVERDLTLLTSLGVFAWQRIVKDVSRALPASGRSSAAMAKTMRDSLFQLSSNSSYVPYTSKDNFILPPSKYSQQEQDGMESTNPFLQQEWNSPLDEIKLVSAQIRDILQGKTVLSIEDLKNRGLKSVVPAGSNMNTERQRRAYQRRKEQILNRERENVDVKLGRVVSTVSDTVWELNKEFQAEGNDPGYRVGTFVRSIQGNTDQDRVTMRLEESSRSKYAFFLDDPLDEEKPDQDSTKVKNMNIMNDDRKSSSIYNSDRLSLSTLQDERAYFTTGIRLCLEQPQKTWLVPELVQQHVQNSSYPDASEASIQNVISSMTFIRDNIDADMELCEKEMDVTYSEAKRIFEFQKLRQMLDSIVSLAAVAAGSLAADKLRNELIDKDGTIASLERILEIREKEGKRSIFDNWNWKPKVNAMYKDEKGKSKSKPTMVLDAVVERNKLDSGNAISVDWDSLDSNDLEVLSDDDFSKTLKLKRTTRGISSSSETVLNPLIAVTLRAVDILFFVIEKTVTFSVPPIFAFGDRMKLVVDNLARNGMGKSGWEMLRNLKKSKYAVDK